MFQVLLVGDFNVAAQRRDMHPTFNFDKAYDKQELQASASRLALHT
jgi:hypothetical protein